LIDVEQMIYSSLRQ